MADTVILGCGYSGQVLAQRLVRAGREVLGTARQPQSLAAIAKTGASALKLDLSDEAAIRKALRGARAVVLLAPPEPGTLEPLTAALKAEAAGQVIVYGSTTGVYPSSNDPEVWVDEDTPTDPQKEDAIRRLEVESALSEITDALCIVRIAAIYGPTRTLAPHLRQSQFKWSTQGGRTSRIHVSDLARLLEAALKPSRPRKVIACDDQPEASLAVAQYTAELLGLPPPETSDEAPSWGGRACRSKERQRMIGPLDYPSYREGVPASLKAEGLL